MLVLAQNQCTGSLTEYVLNSNNIRASFFPRGNKFTNGTQGGFLVPYPSKERLSTIPDSTMLCLKNLIALDIDGNNLHLGSECLVVHRQVVTGNQDPDDDTISIYPNPTRNTLYVETHDEVTGEIINSQGQSFQKVRIKNDYPVDVSDLSPGVYLLRISGSSHTYKVVIY